MRRARSAVAMPNASKRRSRGTPSSRAVMRWCAMSSAKPFISTRRSARRQRARWRQLFAKIDAEPARRQVSLNLGSRISEFFASLTPRTLALASGAAVLAILVQAGFIAGVMLNETKIGGYQTASAPTTAPDAGTFALIQLRAAGFGGRRHQVSRNQQAVDCKRTDGRRLVQGSRRGDGNPEGRARPHREEAAGR